MATREGELREEIERLKREHAEKLAELERSRDELLSILEGTPSLIIRLDRDLNVQYTNKYLPGHTPETVLGKYYPSFLPAEHVEPVTRICKAVLETGEPAEYEVPPHPGVYDAWFQGWIFPVRTDGKIESIIVHGWDVTERVMLQNQLVAADRMAVIGVLAAGVAHEINNPLTYVLASIQRLQRESTVVSPWVDDAMEGARRIRDVVRDLSTLSRDNRDFVDAIDLRPVLRSSIRIAGSELRYRASVEVEIGEVPLVLAKPGRLGQVFVNLLINAAQAIPVGGVSTHRVTVQAGTSDEGDAFVEVADTGAGIDSELLPRIFEPFVSGKEPALGTGLGLYICQSITQELGGSLEVKYTDEKGTCFRLSLPRGEKPEAPAPAQNEGTELGRLRLLVVDDEPGIGIFLRDSLKEHDLVIATTGRDALEQMRESKFDLVLCDLIMPGMTGMEVYERIISRDDHHAERLLFMTAGAFTKSARGFVVEHADRCLEKPFSLEELRAFLARFIVAD